MPAGWCASERRPREGAVLAAVSEAAAPTETDLKSCCWPARRTSSAQPFAATNCCGHPCGGTVGGR